MRRWQMGVLSDDQKAESSERKGGRREEEEGWGAEKIDESKGRREWRIKEVAGGR